MKTAKLSKMTKIALIGLFMSPLAPADLTKITPSLPLDPSQRPSRDWTSVESLLFPADAKKPFFSTDALLVIKNGNVEYEKYWNGNHAETSHISWSVSKSLSSLIWGAALLKGDVELHSSLCKVAPKFEGRINCQLTWDHLLSWSSGLSFLESYEGDGNRTQSSVGQMLYGDGKYDSVEFVLKHRQIYQPGTHYYYSTGDSTVLLGLLKYVYDDAHNSSFPHKLLFQPLGMKSAAFERDISGHFLGGSSAFLSARDLAKIGELILGRGVWRGQQVLPGSYLDYLFEENPNWKTSEDSEREWIPLRHWWKVNVEALGLDREPTFPKDIYAARGHWGQYLIVIPSRKIVLVRYGLDLEGRVNIIEIIKRTLQVLGG